MQLRCATRARGSRRRALRQCIKLNGCDRRWIKIKLLANSGVHCTNSIINKGVMVGGNGLANYLNVKPMEWAWTEMD